MFLSLSAKESDFGVKDSMRKTTNLKVMIFVCDINKAHVNVVSQEYAQWIQKCMMCHQIFLEALWTVYC